LANKQGRVTARASGMGKGTALATPKEGTHLAIAHINKEKGKETLTELNQYTEGMTAIQDMSVEAKVITMVQQAIDTYGQLDIQVNDAHASKQAPFIETTLDMFDLSFNTGFYPTFNFMKAAYPNLKKSEGKVINFASGAGMNGQPTQTAYAAAK